MEHDHPRVIRNRQEGDKAIRIASVDLTVLYLIYPIKAQTSMDPFAWRRRFAIFPAKTVYCCGERRLFLEIDHVENRHDGVLQYGRDDREILHIVRKETKSGLSVFRHRVYQYALVPNSLDIGAACRQLLLDPLISPVQMIYPIDDRLTFGGEARQHQ